MTQRRDDIEERRPDRRNQLASFLLATAAGIASNQVNGQGTLRIVAAAVMVAALLIVSDRVRRLPPRAPLTRHSIRIMLVVGFLAAVLAVARPGLAHSMIFVAVALIGAAILIPSDRRARLVMLFGAAFVGGGVALIGDGFGMAMHGYQLTGIAIVVGGVASSLAGIVVLVNGEIVARILKGDADAALRVRPTLVTLGTAMVGLGVSSLGAGIAAMVDGSRWLGAGGAGMGALFVGAGTAIIFWRYRLLGLAVVGLGMLIAATGIAVMIDEGNIVMGVAGVGFGVAGVGMGVAFMTTDPSLFGVAVVAGGLVGGYCGIAFVFKGQPLLGVALMGGGMAAIGVGVGFFARGIVGERLGKWLVSLVRTPDAS